MLHQALVRAVLADVVTLQSPEHEQVLAVVEPWVHLKALTKLDERSLADVYESCQRIESMFHIRPTLKPTLRFPSAISIGIAASVIAISFFVFRAVMPS